MYRNTVTNLIFAPLSHRVNEIRTTGAKTGRAESVVTTSARNAAHADHDVVIIHDALVKMMSW